MFGRRFKLGRVAALIGTVAVSAALLTAAPADATLQLLTPNPGDPSTFFGHGGYSADGLGQNTTGGTVQAEVPSGSSVVQAYLYGTYFFEDSDGPDVTTRTLDFDGTTVVLDTLANSEPGFCCGLYTARGDVTSQVATKVGSGGGITDFAVNTDHFNLDGVALVVIYANPTSPEVTIAVLDGGSKQVGDTVTFNFASPVDPTEPGFQAVMSLGSGFSFQNLDGGHTCGGSQFSSVAVNGAPLTSCAGNYDDGSGQNGALITVGGVGDSVGNPVDPTTHTGEDDELYDLVPLMSVGDTALTVDTENPSGDDNLFLAVISVTAEAGVTTEICDNSVDDDGDALVDADDPDCTTTTPEICDNNVDDDGDSLIDADDPDCASGQDVSGTKYYDADTDGVRDAGEVGIADWLIDVTDSSGTTTAITDAAGDYAVAVEPGNVDVVEQQPAGWLATAPAGGAYDDVVVTPNGEAAGLDFGNVCVGGGGARTRGFWQNENGKALFETDAAGALALLQGLNLRAESGSDFQPTSYTQVRSWIREARSGKNAAYMLSAQLATMALNVKFGLVDPSALIQAVGSTSDNAAGFATVQALIAEADAALAADGQTPNGDEPNRGTQLLLSNILDRANNNLTFAQAGPEDCPDPFFPLSFSDNFNAENGGTADALNYTSFASWGITDGTADLIGAGGGFDLHPGNGLYVDLDGSTGDAGVLATNAAFPLLDGGTYRLTFDLGGSQRGSDETVSVTLGSYTESFSVLSADALTTVTRDLVISGSELAPLTFENAGGDNIGAILDNVTLNRIA